LGIVNLLKEFDSELINIGVLVDDLEASKKLAEQYNSIVEFSGIDSDGIAIVSPSRNFRQ
jgi:purine operon repressor